MEHIGVGLRAVATIIDTLLLMVIAYLIALLTGATTASGFNLTGAPAFLWFFIAIGYYILMEGQFGATIGKKLVGLKVVKVDGQALDWQAAPVGVVDSGLPGPKGNREFFLHLVHRDRPARPDELDTWIDRAVG